MFEYYICTFNTQQAVQEKVKEALNVLGKEGWELVSIVKNDELRAAQWYDLYFKRNIRR